MRTKTSFARILALLVLPWATAARGTDIPLNNPSLESGGGVWVNPGSASFTGWLGYGPVGSAPVAHTGSQSLWNCWGYGWNSVSQNSSYTIVQAGETLTAGVWAKTDSNLGSGTAWFNLTLLLDGGAVAFTQPNYPAGQGWTQLTASYVTTSADMGKTIGISFGTDGGPGGSIPGYCYMDDASLGFFPPPGAPTAAGTASPNPANMGQSVRFAVTVTNGISPIITSVTLDATPIGGGGSVVLLSDGGNVYTNSVTVAGATSFGSPMALVAMVTDGNSLSGAANISLTIPTCFVWSVSGRRLALNWPSGSGWQLQAETNKVNPSLTTNWVVVAGATTPYTNSIDPANASVFYRVKAPVILFQQPSMSSGSQFKSLVTTGLGGFILGWPYMNTSPVPVGWDVGAFTGFSLPASLRSQYQWAANTNANATAVQGYGDTLGMWFNTASAAFPGDLLPMTPAYSWPDGQPIVPFQTASWDLSFSFELKIPTAQRQNQAQVYANAYFLFQNTNTGIQFWYGAGLFDLRGAPSADSVHFDTGTQHYILDTIWGKTSCSHRGPNSVGFQATPWSGFKFFDFRISQAEFQSALAKLSLASSAFAGTMPQDYRLLSINVNPEAYVSTSTSGSAATLGAAVRKIQAALSPPGQAAP